MRPSPITLERHDRPTLPHAPPGPVDEELGLGDAFGFAVALDGDRALVGAPYDDTLGFSVGQAHLFDAVTGDLLETLDRPVAEDAPVGTLFGVSVALSGDLALVGASLDDGPEALSAGRAYLLAPIPLPGGGAPLVVALVLLGAGGTRLLHRQC